MYAPGTLEGCTCEHDRLCPSAYTMTCECHLIAEVRADERRRNGIPEPTVYGLSSNSNTVELSGQGVNTQSPADSCSHVYEEWRGMGMCIECGIPQPTN